MPNGRTLEQANKQLALLAAENRRLAAELEGLQKQGLVLEKVASEARTVQAEAEKVAAALKSKLEISERQLAENLKANKELTAQVTRMSKQVSKTPLNPLTIEEGSALFDRVIGAFRTSKTLQVSQASLNLKLATAKLGDTAVLLLPDPKAVDPATLHELKIDLTSVASTEPASETEPLPIQEARTVSRTVTARTAKRRTAKASARKRR